MTHFFAKLKSVDKKASVNNKHSVNGFDRGSDINSRGVEAQENPADSTLGDVEKPNAKYDSNYNVTQSDEDDSGSQEDSPYESVRAAVRNSDGQEIANTLRAWILGFFFVTIASGINMFLSMRSPAITVPTVVILLLVYPVGCLWAKLMPMKRFRTFGVTWTLNPGPFTIKEHSVVTLMANVTFGYAYSTDALLALQAKPLYNIHLGWGFQLLFTLSTQLIGISLAGLFRRFLVWPAALIWPANFSVTTLLYALHDKSRTNPDIANGWTISRYRYFLYVGLASFAYYWFPGVLWQGLSVFAFVSWIRPNNVTLNQLFGGFTGLSLIPLTFDWTYVSAYLQDPLLSPTLSHLNTLIGLGIFVIITTIGISYTGALYTDYLPINTSTTFDNTQQEYNVTRVMKPADYSFDLTEYRKYSPLFLAPTFALNYGLSFAALTASIIHTIIYHGKAIVYQLQAAKDQAADVHLKLMRKYREAPDWWYLGLFVISVCLGLSTVLGYSAQIPWWGFFVSCFIPLVFIIPCCIILGITNIQLSLNVLGPFLGGLIIPGKPIGVMIFKVYSVIVLSQAQTFSQDLKLAQYMKIPPRITFSAQVAAAIWSCFVQIAVMNWTLNHIDGVCGSEQVNHFTCPNGRTFFSSSIVWGLVGPKRMFGSGSIYVSFNWFWLVGFLLPIVFYYFTRIFKTEYLQFLNAPVMLGAMAWLPPATPLSFSSWAIVGLVFNYGIRKRFNGWWKTYNYLTAAALDSGLIISTIVIFLAITLPNVSVPQWWGNTVSYETSDYLGTAIRKTVSGGQIFGPKTW